MKKIKWNNIFIIATFVAGALFISNRLLIMNIEIGITLGTTFLLISVSMMIWKYLSQKDLNIQKLPKKVKTYHEVISNISEINRLLDILNKGDFPESEKYSYTSRIIEIYQSIEDRLIPPATRVDYSFFNTKGNYIILKTYLNRNIEEIERQNRNKPVQDKNDYDYLDQEQTTLINIFHDSIQRNLLEIQQLNKRANLYLIFGSILTFFSAIFLIIVVEQFISYKIELEDNSIFGNFNNLIFFIARLMIIIFIEVFAFYFLKLYSSTNKNIQYYNNELTNIEHKFVALMASILNNADKNLPLANSINELIKTERNLSLEIGKKNLDSYREKEFLEYFNKFIDITIKRFSKPD
ncbi:hypothetical protein [Leptospira wolffii]|uniref:hypothetical protein n=1 Tax=Leptospira wolffii TaxID=409998 RepID=UPI0003547021|nr:hypothetical protein [Leptospira wolffii]EPG67398.1 hypothetical protein LEP1GSC061_2089 [Leptospira wolffii serovar Khorat str. Khorat-H2]